MRLSVAPTSDVVVELRPSDSRITLSGTGVTAVGGAYRVTLNAGNWPTGVRVTVTAVDDFVRQDAHNTTIDLVVVSGPTAAPARLDVLAYDDETAGIVTVETGSGTLVVAGDTTPDNYFLRLTRRPDGTVKVALVTDGQTDVIAGGRIAYEAIGGDRAIQLFIGDLLVSGTTVTRINAAALGDFRDEGFAPGQRIRIAGAGDFTIASVGLDGQTLTLNAAPAAGTFTNAIVSRLINQGLFTGARRLRRDDRHADPRGRQELARATASSRASGSSSAPTRRCTRSRPSTAPSSC